MEEQISIVKNRNNSLEFEVDVDGIRSDNMDVRFVVKEKDGLQYTFEATAKENSNIWEIVIPKSTPLSKSTYPFSIEVVVENYLFTPYSGTLSVMEKPSVTKQKDKPSETPKVSGIKTTVDKKKKFSVEAPEKFDKVEKPAENPVEKKEVKKEEKSDEEKAAIAAKAKAIRDKKLKEALAEFNKEKEVEKVVEDIPEPPIEEPVENTAPDDLPPSLLDAAINHLNRGSNLSEQAKKVQDIVKRFKT